MDASHSSVKRAPSLKRQESAPATAAAQNKPSQVIPTVCTRHFLLILTIIITIFKYIYLLVRLQCSVYYASISCSISELLGLSFVVHTYRNLAQYFSLKFPPISFYIRE